MNGTIYTVVGEKSGDLTKQRLQECIPGDGVHQQHKSTRHRRSPKSSPNAAKKHHNKRTAAKKRHSVDKRADSAKQARNNRRNASGSAPGTKIKVTNLDYDIPEKVLRTFFSQKGSIAKLELLRNKNGRSNGVCFITYVDESAGSAAIRDYQGQIAQSRPLRITPVVQGQERSRHGIQSKGGNGGHDASPTQTVELMHVEMEASFETEKESTSSCVQTMTRSAPREEEVNTLQNDLDEMEARYDEALYGAIALIDEMAVVYGAVTELEMQLDEDHDLGC